MLRTIAQLLVLLGFITSVWAGPQGDGEGVVQAIDTENSTVLINHGPIGNLMGPMTMEFPVTNANLLKSIKQGDPVVFTVENPTSGEYIITAIRRGEDPPAMADAPPMTAPHHSMAGMWMIEYQFMRMNMHDLLAGSTEVTPAAALDNDEYKNLGSTYMMAPTDMTMDMHMLMAMYSQTDRLAWEIMVNYLSNHMDMIMTMAMGGHGMEMDSAGLGDTQVALRYALESRSSDQLALRLGLSLPTGSIDEKMPDGTLLPYGMQLGSGTFDLETGIEFDRASGSVIWGASAEYTMRLGDNKQNYNVGDRFEASTWADYRLHRSLGLHGSLTYLNWEPIHGHDARILHQVSIPNVPGNYGGDRIDLGVGMVGHLGNNHSLTLEYRVPVYQNLNGIQMKTENLLLLNYMLMWM